MTRLYRCHRCAAVVGTIILISVALVVLGTRAYGAGTAEQQTYHRQQQTGVDWRAVGQALGKAGQMQPGDVYRVSLPRTDLAVAVDGVPLQPTFALGSYAAFKPIGDGGDVMVMGDLVLLDAEVPAVMSGLFAGGLTVTALHNHLTEMAPHVMYLHYTGQGDAVALATALRAALSVSGTPLGPDPAEGTSSGIALDALQLDAILGRTGSVDDADVYRVSVPRAETITEMGMELPPAMGTASALNVEPLPDGRAAITGDFVLIGSEVNPVAQVLRANGIVVTALHNHALADEPRLFYLHFWGTGDAAALARGLRAALDQTNSRR